MSSSNKNKSYNNFRSTMHIAMGILYIVIGVTVLYLKFFGQFELSPGLAYLIGGLMLVYGLFRIWRGWRNMQNTRKSNT